MLKSDNIQLRPLEKTDLDFLYEIENDARYWYLGSVTAPYSKSVLSKYIDAAHLDIYTTKQLRFIVDKEGVPIGAIDIYDFDPVNKRAGVGIIIIDNYKKKGLGIESLELLKNYCRQLLGLKQLYATVPASNLPSVKLFKKAGFTTAGIKKDWLLRGDDWEDALEMQFLFS